MSTSLVDRLWYGRGRPLALLTPLAWLYRAVSVQRRKAWQPVTNPSGTRGGGEQHHRRRYRQVTLTARLVQRMNQEGWKPVILTGATAAKAITTPCWSVKALRRV